MTALTEPTLPKSILIVISILFAALVTWPAPAQAAAVATSARYGIAAGGELAYQSREKLDTYMKNVKAVGVERVRFDIDWDAIQFKGHDFYDWSGYDPMVDAAAAAGLRVTAVITHTPKWARAPECAEVSSRCRPINADAFAHFSGLAAKRYAPKGVDEWEIWNEPNLSALWLPAVDAVAYTEYLTKASAEIRKNNPKALILVGGLTHTFTNNGNSSPADFLRVIYERGAGNSFDAVAVHPYTYPFIPSYTGEPTGWKSLKDTRQVIVDHGQPNKKIWITEFGAPTGGPMRQAISGTTRTALGSDHVTEALNKRILEEATHFVQNNTWIDVFFWYSYQDKNSKDYSTTENFYGLVRSDGSRKPSYEAFRHAIKTSR